MILWRFGNLDKIKLPQSSVEKFLYFYFAEIFVQLVS